MSIGLVAALPAEIKCLTRQDIKVNTPIRINNVVIVFVSGMGAKLAEEAAERLLYERVNSLLSWGTAAGLGPNIKSGDLVLPETIVDRYGTTFNTDNKWTKEIVHLMQNSSIKIHHGLLAETIGVLDTQKQKNDLAERTGAIAADMETAAIARVAKRNKLPCTVIRSIVDESCDIMPYEVLKHIDCFGNPNIMEILDELIFNPGLFPKIFQLAGAMRAATTTLSTIAKATHGLSLQPV